MISDSATFANQDQPPDRVRVLHVFADPGTGVKLVAGMARHAVAAGFDVEFACNTGEFLPQLEQMGLPVWRVPLSRTLLTMDHFRAFVVLRRLMRERRYAVVHTHTPFASFIGRAAAKAARIPVVIYHMRGSAWERPSGATRAIFTQLERLAARWTSAILTVNCEDAADVVAYGIAASSEVECLHCGASGLDPLRYVPQSSEVRGRVRRELGLGDDTLVIGFLGRFVREKGILELLAAFDILAAERSDVRLLIVGGTLASERDQQTGPDIHAFLDARPQTAARVKITDFRDDVPEVLSAMDIVVQPSHREGFANILAEAAAVGRAVIGADTRGVREVVVDGETGIVVPVGDVPAMAGALRELAADCERREAMGAAGRRQAVRRFNRIIPCERVVDWYRRLLADAEAS